MLAHRIIPVILMKGRQAVKGERFGWQRPVGQLKMTVRVYSSRMVDELALLDVSGSVPDLSVVRDFADYCLAPLMVGGGVQDVEIVRELLANGADKISINSAAVRRPELIELASRKVGRQSIVASIDAKDGEVHIDGGKTPTGLNVIEWAQEVERLGAGEILINSIDREGTMSGYDLELVQSVTKSVSVPVVACGGAGEYQHMADALNAGAHAVAAGALWSFTDATPAGAAGYLASQGFTVRQDYRT